MREGDKKLGIKELGPYSLSEGLGMRLVHGYLFIVVATLLYNRSIALQLSLTAVTSRVAKNTVSIIYDRILSG